MQISKELNALARITATANWSIPPVTLRNNWRPYHETDENPRIVTIVHNWPPIDSPVRRLTIRGTSIEEILNLNIKKILSVNIKKILNLNIRELLKYRD